MDAQYKNSGGKVIGKVSGDVFCKKVVKSRHLLRKWDAWGIDKSVIDSLVEEGVQKIIIHEKEAGRDYEVSVKDFAEKGIEAEFPGYGKQIFLPRENFRKETEKKEKRKD